MDIPRACMKCKYCVSTDLSIDDITTLCLVTNIREDLCDFPNREDGTLRQTYCPLPLLSKSQLEEAEKRLDEMNPTPEARRILEKLK